MFFIEHFNFGSILFICLALRKFSYGSGSWSLGHHVSEVYNSTTKAVELSFKIAYCTKQIIAFARNGLIDKDVII